MRGHLVKRYHATWNIVLEFDRRVDPATKRLKRVRKWFTVKGTRREAEKELAKLLDRYNTGQVIEPSKMPLSQWLDEWMEMAIKPPHKRLRTHETYRSVIDKHLKPALGQLLLGEIRPSHLQAYYERSPLSRATLQQHHAILHSALKAAVLQNLIPRNAGSLVISKPRAARCQEDILKSCWEEVEARQFLKTAKAAGPQPGAFYSLALEAGLRKAELCGLFWSDFNEKGKTLSILRQLVKRLPPQFGPPKNGKSRIIDLSQELVELLRRHRAHQTEQRLVLGTAYRNHGLIFAKDFGGPLLINNLGQREFARLIEKAGVRPITFHGLRHTCATLLLNRGIPAKVVSERLGHKRIEITLDLYAHALPSMQQAAAEELAIGLHGTAR